MEPLFYIDRESGKTVQEKIYGQKALQGLYGNKPSFWKLLFPLVTRFCFFSRFYGWLQRCSWTREKIRPFIQEYGVDEKEFLEKADSFCSFNDFFIRKLRPDARPIATDPKKAIIPADGRYLVYPNIAEVDGFLVKGEKFTLEDLLHDSFLAKEYQNGSMVIARLAPCDYHRFHFPVETVPSAAKLLNGLFFSVNPIALRRNIHIFSQNKRAITHLHSELYGTVLFIEVGATNVASIIQTYSPGLSYQKGEEKGYFSFGGSSLILLFPQGSISFEADLIENTRKGIETLAKMGQPLGTAERKSIETIA